MTSCRKNRTQDNDSFPVVLVGRSRQCPLFPQVGLNAVDPASAIYLTVRVLVGPETTLSGHLFALSTYPQSSQCRPQMVQGLTDFSASVSDGRIIGVLSLLPHLGHLVMPLGLLLRSRLLRHGSGSSSNDPKAGDLRVRLAEDDPLTERADAVGFMLRVVEHPTLPTVVPLTA